MSKLDITWDIEATNLLNEETIDYTASPYKLKAAFGMHCIVVEEHVTGKILAFYDGDKIELDGTTYEGDGEFTTTLEKYEAMEYEHHQLDAFVYYVKDTDFGKIVAHNGLNYDLLACKLYWQMAYTVEEDTWCGKPVQFEDTLVTSKTLNPDRFGGHSLDDLGKLVGLRKIEFRKKIPLTKRFQKFAPDMLFYCIRDVQVNTKVFHYLEKEKGTWDWSDALSLEKSVKELITRQEHRGFNFDTDLAERNVPELDGLMQTAREKVEPILPSKTPTIGFLKSVTPAAGQFKKDGKCSANFLKFIEKHDGELIKVGDSGLDAADHKLSVFGKEWELPLKSEPMIKSLPTTCDDSVEIKEWLVGLGWQPSEWTEKDITMFSKKKQGKLPFEKFEIAVDKYVAQTLS